MSKIFMYANKLLVKVTGHKYTSTTVKLPFINISFAPAQTTALNGAVFFFMRLSIGRKKTTLPLVGCQKLLLKVRMMPGGDTYV